MFKVICLAENILPFVLALRFIPNVHILLVNLFEISNEVQYVLLLEPSLVIHVTSDSLNGSEVGKVPKLRKCRCIGAT
jgi:hypothetical protein